MNETETTTDYLLIAKKDGEEESRRQRRFTDIVELEHAILRWRKEGYNEWWVFEPRENATEDQPPRRLMRQWVD